LANVYSKSYLQSSDQVAANSRALLAERVLPAIQSFADAGQVIDVHDLDNALAMDFMSAYQFGIGNGTNFVQNTAERRHILHHYHGRRPYEFYSSELPWLKPLCRAVGIHLIPRQFDASNDILEEWLRRMCNNADRTMNQSALTPGQEPIVYKQFKQGLYSIRNKNPHAGKAYDELILPTVSDTTNPTQLEVYSEMLDQLGAGHETSAMALTYLWYEMSNNPYLQTLLRKEIRTLSPRIVWPTTTDTTNAFNLPSPKDIDALPLLNAVVLEVLRLHTPIPGIEPRVSPSPAPPGGHTLGSYTGIPGNVRVSSMPYTLHRNEVVFPDPETFNPRRWLDSSPEKLKEMHRWFWAFGSGGRMCIGSHLALQEIKLIVCAILGNWEVSVPDGGDAGIEKIDAYTVRPVSNQLLVVFKAAK
jgi:cytochrome P450